MVSGSVLVRRGRCTLIFLLMAMTIESQWCHKFATMAKGSKLVPENYLTEEMR